MYENGFTTDEYDYIENSIPGISTQMNFPSHPSQYIGTIPFPKGLKTEPNDYIGDQLDIDDIGPDFYVNHDLKISLIKYSELCYGFTIEGFHIWGKRYDTLEQAIHKIQTLIGYLRMIEGTDVILTKENARAVLDKEILGT